MGGGGLVHMALYDEFILVVALVSVVESSDRANDRVCPGNETGQVFRDSRRRWTRRRQSVCAQEYWLRINRMLKLLLSVHRLGFMATSVKYNGNVPPF